MALLHSPVLTSAHGGRCLAPTGVRLAAQDRPPLYHASNGKNLPSSAFSSRLTPPLTGLRLQKGARSRSMNFVAERRLLPRPVLCHSNGSGGGGWRDDTGVEDEDTDIEELLARLQRKLVIDVRPVQEARWEEEEEAVRKSREMLFRQFCLHLGLTPQEFRAMWWARGGGAEGGGADERLQLVRGFLEEEWGWRYRPLSPKAAVEMLDEHMGSLDKRAAAAPAAARPSPHTATISTAARRRHLLPNWWRRWSI